MILKSVIRDVNGSGAVVERQQGDSGVKWSWSGAGVGIFLFYIYFILRFLKIKTKEFSFRMVFNKFSTYKYIQIQFLIFRHFNISTQFSTSYQHFNNIITIFQQVFNKLSTQFSKSQKLLFLKINFFCATNNSTSHQLIKK